MSVETLVKDLREQNASLLTVTQHAIGAVKEIMGHYGTAVSTFEQVASFLMGDGPGGLDRLAEIQNRLDDLFAAIKEGFEEVLAAEQAEGILSRLRDLDDWIVPARSTVQMLTRYPPEDPDPNAYPYNDYLRTAFDAINGLSVDDKWSRVYYESLYERPLGSNIGDPVDGEISAFTEVQSGGTTTFYGTDLYWGCARPGKKTGDMIWSYTYVLPIYMEAVLHLLVIVGACDPNHRTNHKATYLQCADFLLEKHNRIEGDIQKLALPIYHVNQQDTYQSWGLHGRPWGVVEPFSATTSIGCYNTLRPYGDPAKELGAATADIWARGSIALQEQAVRTLRRWRSVYTAIGLPAVWKTINDLRTLAGEPSLGLDHSPCSLRKLAEDALAAHRRREAVYGRSVPAEDLSLRTLVKRLDLEGTVSMRQIVRM